MDPFEVLGVTEEMTQKFIKDRAIRGRRDARVCVCGHAGGAHYTPDGSDIDDAAPGGVGCQAGKVPCMCNTFNWVLTASDVRSFIQKTRGPGDKHALTKGLASSRARGITPEWREGLSCFSCKGNPTFVGPLVAIAYNDRWGEALRPTEHNYLHCAECRAKAAAFAASQAAAAATPVAVDVSGDEG